MRPRLFLTALLGFFAATGIATADQIVLKGGRSIDDVDVVEETYEAVSYKIHGSSQAEPASNVLDVVYARRPIGFDDAKQAYRQGRWSKCFENAKDLLKAREAWVRQYATFYAAEARRNLGDGPGAEELYEQLVAEFPKTRFYAQARIGQGLVRLDRRDFAGAQKAFEQLASEARAKKLDDEVVDDAEFRLAATLEAQGKLEEALKRYDALVARTGTKGGRTGGRAMTAALRLRAVTDPSKAGMVLAGLQSALDGWYALRPDAQGERTEELASIWNAFGDVHAAKGDHQAALLAYLRVVTNPDLGNVASERAKALYGAAQSFEKAKTEDWKNRAEQLRRELRETYPNSPWAKK